VLAEYIVSLDVECTSEIREEWDPYDLITPDGIKLEIKSGSYLQSWQQKKLSTISFGIQKTYAWDELTNKYSDVLMRQSDVYVFCVLAHKDKLTVDPLNMVQWEFYVLPTKILNSQVHNQKTISLSSLLKLSPTKCDFGQIGNVINCLDLNN